MSQRHTLDDEIKQEIGRLEIDSIFNNQSLLTEVIRDEASTYFS